MPEETTQTTTLQSNVMLIGSSDGLLTALDYTNTASSSFYSAELQEPINHIIFTSNNSSAYISSSNYLYRYVVEQYVGGKEIYEDEKIVANGEKITFYNGSAFSVSPISNSIIQRDATSLSEIRQYNQLDAPFKIVWSEYHDAFFAAGSNIVWKIKDDIVTPVYEINDYTVKDIDVSKEGYLCILLRGYASDIFRILDNDLYSWLSNIVVSDARFMFCKYCDNENKFYALSELNSQGTEYTANHYIYDIFDKTMDIVEFDAQIVTTTTTTAIGNTNKVIELKNPKDGSEIQIGTNIDIQWLSSKSINDSVRIELYKGNTVSSTIASSTNNTGVYSWQIPSSVEEDSDYKVRLTWLSTNSSSDNYSENIEPFSLLNSIVTTTTTTIDNVETAIGIDYDFENKWIVILLKNGLYALYSIIEKITYGLIETNLSSVSCFAVRSADLEYNAKQSKVRIFVGSGMYMSDKWDSGIIETGLKSMYYGGGNNLEAGKTYYVHIHTYSSQYGWGDLQIKEFKMPN